MNGWMEGWIILKLIFKQCDWRKWTGFICLRMKKFGGELKWGNENLGP
jgi:hypothetical protein